MMNKQTALKMAIYLFRYAEHYCAIQHKHADTVNSLPSGL